jgi:hypothetical protein
MDSVNWAYQKVGFKEEVKKLVAHKPAIIKECWDTLTWTGGNPPKPNVPDSLIRSSFDQSMAEYKSLLKRFNTHDL